MRPCTFGRALEGARLLADRGFAVSLTTVVTRENLDELVEIPDLVCQVGAESQHLMWAHKRGRAAADLNGFFPPVESLLAALCRTLDAAESVGVVVDNLEAVKRRVNGVPGIKYDLGNGGWDSPASMPTGGCIPPPRWPTSPALLPWRGRWPTSSIGSSRRRSSPAARPCGPAPGMSGSLRHVPPATCVTRSRSLL